MVCIEHLSTTNEKHAHVVKATLELNWGVGGLSLQSIHDTCLFGSGPGYEFTIEGTSNGNRLQLHERAVTKWNSGGESLFGLKLNIC